MNSAEELRNFAESLVDVDLFEESLRQPLGILVVIGVRPSQYLAAVVDDSFTLDERSLEVVLSEAEFVLPKRLTIGAPNRDIEDDVWVSSRGKAT